MKQLLLALAIFWPCCHALADSADDVRCREIGFSLSVENQDISAFASFIDEDARFIGSTVLRGRDDVVAGWQVFFVDSGQTLMWRPQFVEVLEDGKLALSRGPYKLTALDEDGNAVEIFGTFNSIWRLHDDGEWYVVFDAGSPAAGPLPREVADILDSTCDATASDE